MVVEGMSRTVSTPNELQQLPAPRENVRCRREPGNVIPKLPEHFPELVSHAP